MKNRVTLCSSEIKVGSKIKEVWAGDDGLAILTSDGDGIIMSLAPPNNRAPESFRKFVRDRYGTKRP